jgi:hypothetical protein
MKAAATSAPGPNLSRSLVLISGTYRERKPVHATPMLTRLIFHPIVRVLVFALEELHSPRMCAKTVDA